MSLPKSKQPKNNKSYDGLVSVVSDPLLRAKFKFVEMLSWKFNKFLRGFQTDYTFFFYIRNIFIRKMRLRSGKN